MSYPIKYNMDGFFIRIERDGHFENVCFSDLTPEERRQRMEWWAEENFISAIEILCNALREIGDRYGFIANDADRLEDRSEL